MMPHAECRPWVIKVGGSLDGAGTLRTWLDCIATVEAPPLVIVPGGGAYADAVRTQQRRAGFDDSTAHAMALLAMDQYGLQLIATAGERLRAARTHEDMQLRWRQQQLPVWLPSQWADADDSLARNWRVTSDSLAFWLAGRLDAAGAVLIKSVEVGAGTLAASEALRRGWVDECLIEMLPASSCPVWLVGPAHGAALPGLLKGEAGVALRLT